MKKFGVFAILVLVVSVLGFERAASAPKPTVRAARLKPRPEGISPSCATPRFPQIPSRAIDSQCGNEGNGGDEAEQNTLKNNFCPTTSTATSVTIARFSQLQDNVESNSDINFGGSGPTTDRTPL